MFYGSIVALKTGKIKRFRVAFLPRRSCGMHTCNDFVKAVFDLPRFSLVQLVEVETLMAIFNGNPHLTNQISKGIVQYVIQCIEKGRHSKYLEFLQTIVRVNGSYNRRVQDMVMQEVCKQKNKDGLCHREKRILIR